MTKRKLLILLVFILIIIATPFLLFYFTIQMKAPRNIVVTAQSEPFSGSSTKTPDNCADYILLNNDSVIISRNHIKQVIHASNLDLEITSFVKEKKGLDIILFTNINTQYKYLKKITDILKRDKVTKIEILPIS